MRIRVGTCPTGLVLQGGRRLSKSAIPYPIKSWSEMMPKKYKSSEEYEYCGDCESSECDC